MVLGFGKRERTTKIIADLRRDYEAALEAQSALIGVYQKFFDVTQTMKQEGILQEPSGRKMPETGVVEMVVGYIKDATDMGSMTKKAIINYLLGRKDELNSIGDAFISTKVNEVLSKSKVDANKGKIEQ